MLPSLEKAEKELKITARNIAKNITGLGIYFYEG